MSLGITTTISFTEHNAALPVLPLDACAMSPYLVAAYETRKPGTTIASFIDYYDNTHVPIIKEAMKDSFPLTYSRYYLKR